MIIGMYNAKLALIIVGYSIQVKWLITLFHFVFHQQPGHKYYCHPLWRFVLSHPCSDRRRQIFGRDHSSRCGAYLGSPIFRSQFPMPTVYAWAFNHPTISPKFQESVHVCLHLPSRAKWTSRKSRFVARTSFSNALYCNPRHILPACWRVQASIYITMQIKWLT